jgi:hypothetical protein
MPMFETYTTALNTQTSAANVADFAPANASRFAPGQALDFDFLLPGSPLGPRLKAFLATAPGAFKETLRGTLHHALTQDPPIPVTIAWSPAYDFSITVTQSPSTASTSGFITIRITSRYPDDAHPLGPG